MKIDIGSTVRSLKRLLFPCLLFFAAMNITAQDGRVQNERAQEADSARIYHVEGIDFALTLRGEQSIISKGAVAGDGILLERSGTISTGAGTFLEIQLIRSGTFIKVSENTSLIYNGIDETGRFADFGLLYGRMRVVPGIDAAKTCPLVVRCGGVAARIEEGDFGIDYALDQNSTAARLPQFRMYAFRGSAEIYPFGGAAAYFGAAKALTLNQQETLTVDVSPSNTFAEKRPLDNAAAAYWNRHNISVMSPIVMPSAAAAAGEPAYTAPPPAPEYTAKILPGEIPREIPPAQENAGQEKPSVMKYRSKNTALILGLFLTVTAFAIQGVSFYVFDAPNNSMARNFYTAAYAPLGLGFVVTLTGILYNPKVSVK